MVAGVAQVLGLHDAYQILGRQRQKTVRLVVFLQLAAVRVRVPLSRQLVSVVLRVRVQMMPVHQIVHRLLVLR